MKPRVVIVDDSLTVRMHLGEAFATAGFDPVLCDSAASAREAFRRVEVDLAILDVVLPDADGVELIEEVRAPVMLLSTQSEVSDRIRGLKRGADEYVGKPYDLAFVISRARELTRDRRARAAVLVIDDSATVRGELTAALEGAGHAVVGAASGEEGLRMAADVRPEAIVVDWGLPGIDGPTVIRRLREDPALRRTPCLLLTGSDAPEGEVGALDAGADAYERKEAGVGVVLTRVASLLRASREPGALELNASLLGPKRVLAVDDSNTYLQELVDHLRTEGWEVASARSGEEALELLRLQPVDCVLLDVVMPGLDGRETCRRIKESPATRGIPVLMLTARDDHQSLIEGMNAGADDYIPKSGDFNVLKARVRAQLRRKYIEDENRRIREELVRKELEAAEARAARELADTRGRLLADLERKNTELDSFSYSVSHDLRAPLRAIEGFSRILLEEHAASLDGEARRLLGVVTANVGRMGELIDDLLELSRLGRVELRRADVDMTVLARAVASEWNVAIEVHPLPPARGDAALLRQVFANLLGNAVKYSRGREPARVEVSGGVRDGERRYEVRDNGVGFEPQYAHKLFGVFQRLHSAREFEGTGVGLSVVRRIVERHGGRVWAEGRPGEGAVFGFSLPEGGDDGERS